MIMHLARIAEQVGYLGIGWAIGQSIVEIMRPFWNKMLDRENNNNYTDTEGLIIHIEDFPRDKNS